MTQIQARKIFIALDYKKPLTKVEKVKDQHCEKNGNYGKCVKTTVSLVKQCLTSLFCSMHNKRAFFK